MRVTLIYKGCGYSSYEWDDIKILLPLVVRIDRFFGGFRVVLVTNTFFEIDGLGGKRICTVLKTYRGRGAKKRCENFIEKQIKSGYEIRILDD